VSSGSEEPLTREGEHVAPGFKAPAYHCPWCGVLASQNWIQLTYDMPTTYVKSEHWANRCRNCHNESVWLSTGPGSDGGPTRLMAHPAVGGGPRPHVDMPDDVRADYEEARSIVARSPRGACALLRLATQKLVDDLESGSDKLNDKIGKLVAHGLPAMVQQALDSLRVVGNESVHPGQLDLRDDVETATALFGLLNLVVEDCITRPKQVQEFYGQLPPSKLQGIAERDASED